MVEALRFTTGIFIDGTPSRYAFAHPTRKMTGADAMAASGAG